ncbi:aliphatic sulfonate ABC transporter substrate-binding protein [[Phormidium ambiguum] IAM M-71]|uniref:Putative aliphatic sulfonates-binding protein n=1 Tax=[Phormidium ambiguum] IAM M-71 TaxID=454136 RepID=A0A1U7I9N8_9CYAN|nr:aliphatic sulfonate ABC transporter substrate-binding protein [Phormidium ambiguum]OKH33242.1 aliphatic sulfonate ABC transporter substrate-binding protein [Phormidium ambiguum IAM M-71]
MQNWQKKLAFWQRKPITRRASLFIFGYSLVVSTSLLSCGTQTNQTQSQTNSPASSNPTSSTASTPTSTNKVVRIVRSKQLTALAVLEKQGTLSEKLAPLGYKVEWLEFAAGPQQLEALNTGNLDIASTAESPPIFIQAAGAPLVYLATTPKNGRAISLLVPTNSPVKNFTDLKGKKVAFQKASIGHYLLVKAIEKEGLKLNYVESVFLPPPDANVAFSQGKVDAWFIWEPFVTRAVQKNVGRVLLDGSELRDTRNFYTTNRQFYKAHPEAIKIFLEELQKAENWSKNNPQEMAQMLAPVTQLDAPTLEEMHKKYEWGLQPITEEVISKQQEVANKWYNLGLIPKQVNVREGFLSSQEYAEFTPKEVLASQQ